MQNNKILRKNMLFIMMSCEHITLLTIPAAVLKYLQCYNSYFQLDYLHNCIFFINNY